MGWNRDYEWEAEVARVYGNEWRGEAPKCFRMGALHAMLSRDEVSPGDLRWHISLSRHDRVPTWDELAKCAHALRPGVVFCIPMPPKSWWISIHDNCLHLHEIKDEPLVNQWREERMGMEQTAGRKYA